MLVEYSADVYCIFLHINIKLSTSGYNIVQPTIGHCFLTNTNTPAALLYSTYTGIEDINIGDTIMSKDEPLPLPPITVEEPTVRMSISGERKG